MFRTALRVGVPIALGTDAGVYPHGMNNQEFASYVNLGMSPAQALLSGTRDDAKLLGIEADVGTLEAGKIADVVAVPGNVLSDIHATEHPLLVMHLGKVIPLPDAKARAAEMAAADTGKDVPVDVLDAFF
jgi:imidazolonepropionase-like amidohydrolase